MWYWAQDGRKIGPVEAAAIEAAIADGTIDAGCLLWRNGFATWQSAGEVAEFAQAFAAARVGGLPPPLPDGSDAADGNAAGNSAGELPEDIALRLKPPATPWSRYWARMVDSLIVSVLVFLAVFAVAVAAPTSGFVQTMSGEWTEALWGIGTVALLCVFTALCLSLFGTTPGKALYRIEVAPMTWTGRSGSFAGRELRVFFAGLGIGFPIAAFCTLLWQHSRLRCARPASYDEGRFLVTQRPIGRSRFWIGALLVILGVVASIGLGIWGKEVKARASAPQSFVNTMTGKSILMPAGWRISEQAGTEAAPVWILFDQDGNTVVFGFEELPDILADPGVYADALVSAFGPSGANDLKISFDPCRPNQILLGQTGMHCAGRQDASGAPAELFVFLDPPGAWRIVILQAGQKQPSQISKNSLIEGLATTTVN